MLILINDRYYVGMQNPLINLSVLQPVQGPDWSLAIVPKWGVVLICWGLYVNFCTVTDVIIACFKIHLATVKQYCKHPLSDWHSPGKPDIFNLFQGAKIVSHRSIAVPVLNFIQTWEVFISKLRVFSLKGCVFFRGGSRFSFCLQIRIPQRVSYLSMRYVFYTPQKGGSAKY